MMTKDEAQEVVDALDQATHYIPDELEPLVKKGIADLVERYDVVSDDTPLVFVRPPLE